MATKKVTQLATASSAADLDLVMIVDVADTAMSPDGTNKQITKANLLTGIGGGGGLLVSGGARIQVSTTTDNGSLCIGWGGSLGFNYYVWSSSIGANPLTTGGDLGTPGTTQIASVTISSVVNTMFVAASSGTATFSVIQEFDSSAEVAGVVMRYMIWKADAGLVTALENGTGGAGLTATLVASAKLTVPASSQSIKPMVVTSTNGVAIAKGDIIFGCTVYDGTVTGTQYFPMNLSIYTV